MLCETCRWTERPGFIRRPAKPDPGPAAPRDQAADFIPCPDCGGQAIAHCCEGLCEQPDARGRYRVAGNSPSKCPRCWSQASKASAGRLARAQMTKNHTQPVAEAM